MRTKRLAIVAGPTGSGKSELALAIAGTLGGEVVNCDSLQVYRHFDIGTAKLPESLRRGIPHHLMDIAEPEQLFTAGDYLRLGRAAIGEISERGRLPVVAGGTGFYLRALTDGLFAGPERNEVIRELLAERERRRPGALHRFLRRLDAAAAGRIHPRDVQKLIRAVEVCLISRTPITEQFGAGRDPLSGYRMAKIGLSPPRAQLYARLDERCSRMFESGLLEEVRSLLARGTPRTAKPFESLGYKEALAVVEGRMAPDEAIAAAQIETRHYAKRQLTWFRREKDICWLEGFGSEPAVQDRAIELVRQIC